MAGEKVDYLTRYFHSAICNSKNIYSRKLTNNFPELLKIFREIIRSPRSEGKVVNDNLYFPLNAILISGIIFSLPGGSKGFDQRAIQLAQTILLNFHPDLKGGASNVLAIMFDMNMLWENYAYWMLKRASRNLPYGVIVRKQQSALFWQHPDRWNLRLRHDLLIEMEKEGKRMSFILDTKWKYRADASIEDVTQMYAYLQYFPSDAAFLVYPDNLMGGRIKAHSGKFYNGAGKFLPNTCGLVFLDLLADGKLDQAVGVGLIEELARAR